MAVRPMLSLLEFPLDIQPTKAYLLSPGVSMGTIRGDEFTAQPAVEEIGSAASFSNGLWNVPPPTIVDDGVEISLGAVKTSVF